MFPLVPAEVYKWVFLYYSTHQSLEGRALLGKIEDGSSEVVELGAVYFKHLFNSLHCHGVAIVHGFAAGLEAREGKTLSNIIACFLAR